MAFTYYVLMLRVVLCSVQWVVLCTYIEVGLKCIKHKMGLSTNNCPKYFANKVTPKDGAKMESLSRSPMVLHTSVHHMSYAM